MTNTNFDLFVFAGEKSGDLHGGHLLKELYAISPSIRITGVGGPAMRNSNMHCLLPMENFQVMGFVDVFMALPRLIKYFYHIKKSILLTQPSAVLLIDYPEFNIRLATHLRNAGFKGRIFHYICPSVWAWRKNRISQMATTLDMLLCILPFEKSCFKNTTLPVHYVGHPLISSIQNYLPQPLPCFSDNDKTSKILAIFPGSRKKELEKNLTLQLLVAKKLRKTHPYLKIALSVSHPSFITFIQQEMKKIGWGMEQIELISHDQSYGLMQNAYIAIAKSGTVTLELALHGVPTIVTYGISSLDVFIARNLLRIDMPYYCLVNILANEEVFKELIGPHLSFETLFTATEALLDNPLLYADCREKCAKVRALLGEGNASQAAAKLIAESLENNCKPLLQQSALRRSIET